MRVTQWLHSNKSCSAVIFTEGDKKSCFCLLSLTDFVKNTLFQNAGLLNIFPNKKREMSKKNISTFFLIFFSHLDPKTTKHLCMKLKLNVTHVVKHHPELSLGSSLFQEDLSKLVFITVSKLLAFCSCYH